MVEQTMEISVGCVDGGLYVGLPGEATLRTCPTAERIVADYSAAHPGQARIVLVDLAGCDWIDSTFAGWLVGLRTRLGRDAGRLVLANCGGECRGALARMHLDTLFDFATSDAPGDVRRVACLAHARPTPKELRLMLEAHEALEGTSDENRRVFAPVVKMLRDRVDRGA